MLLMLEDDSERLERFATTLRSIDPRLTLRAWRDAHSMIREVGPLLQAARLISEIRGLTPPARRRKKNAS
jgi:hypothetical protein